MLTQLLSLVTLLNTQPEMLTICVYQSLLTSFKVQPLVHSPQGCCTAQGPVNQFVAAPLAPLQHCYSTLILRMYCGQISCSEVQTGPHPWASCSTGEELKSFAEFND